MSPVQLPLFPVLEPTKPSSELLAGIEGLNTTIYDLWNKAIDERTAAPAGMKADLRRIAEQLESMLIAIEAVADRHPIKLETNDE